MINLHFHMLSIESTTRQRFIWRAKDTKLFSDWKGKVGHSKLAKNRNQNQFWLVRIKSPRDLRNQLASATILTNQKTEKQKYKIKKLNSLKRRQQSIVCIKDESGEVVRELTLNKWRRIRPERRTALRWPRPKPLTRQKAPEYPRVLKTIWIQNYILY